MQTRLYFLLLLSLWCATSLAAQDKRYALVIGNGHYKFGSLGDTPVSDAVAMRDALKTAGFEVDFFKDLDYRQFSEATKNFGKKIENSGGTALFYFSGHGLYHNGQNYLVPLSNDALSEDDVENWCVPVNRVVSKMRGTTVNLVILDACRDYPLSGTIKSTTKGLGAETPTLPELLIGYATREGRTASTLGEGGLSLYTSQLVKYIRTPGLPLTTVFQNTRQDVAARSQGRQTPQEYGGLTRPFFFLPPQTPDPTPPVKEEVLKTPVTTPRESTERGGTTPVMDRDFDGTPDASDLCPDVVGSEKAFGCPDNDDDGVPNTTDQCPYDAGPKNWQGCPDSDGDGIPNHEDQCPSQAGERANKGCPPPDADRDGVPDATDLCPQTAGLARFSGCPDTDGDDLPDKSDRCPNQKGEKRFGGCPDTDGDGIPDPDDQCPEQKGVSANKGCPPVPEGFVLVKGGSFQMGSEEGDPDEKPIHQVTVSDFYLAKYEVTVAEFKKFVEASGYRTDAEKEDFSYVVVNCSGGQLKSVINWRHDEEGNVRPVSEYSHPVVHVSWNDAIAYCQWLNQETGRTYRLPTEAEWEYAAGNGVKHTKYSWGNGLPVGKKGGNIVDETAKTKCPDFKAFEDYTDGYIFSAPVGSFAPNEFGIYDLSGNVLEWCNDWHGGYYSENQINPTGPSDGKDHVLRGGSWFMSLECCRAAYRFITNAKYLNYHAGFRLASSLQ